MMAEQMQPMPTVRSDGEVYDGPDCLRRQLAAARAVVEAARPIVNAEHDVDPVDVHYLREAIRRYDERCGGGGTPTLPSQTEP